MNKIYLVVFLCLALAFSINAQPVASTPQGHEIQAGNQNNEQKQMEVAHNQNANSIVHHEEEVGHHEDADHHEHSNLGEIAGALGLVTLLSLITTFILGLTMRKNPKVLMPWHKRIATFTLIVGITHGALMMYLH